jgi:hypothetical protein
MKRILKDLLVISLLATVLDGASALFAADSTPKTQDKTAKQSADTAEKSKPKRDWYPFGGIVAAVDKQANTISLKKKSGERVLKLDSKSNLRIGGKPAALGSVKIGDYAHGKLHKDAVGKEVITDAAFDKEKPMKGKAAASKQPQTTPAPKTTE